MHKLVLLRHGESLWNKENRFTGWTDIDLSPKGMLEAREAGRRLSKEGFKFDVAFTSYLKRAIRTLWIALDEMDLMWLPIFNDWRLNERHYGALQGLNKSETAKKFGEEKVHLWRRSYNIRPPAIKVSDKRYSGNDPKYRGIDKKDIPVSECLEDCVRRVIPFWKENIIPELRSGSRILIAAHGNSLRALVKYLDSVPEKEITELNIPTGIPLIYELDSKFKPIKHYYLAKDAELKKKIEKVLHQGKKK